MIALIIAIIVAAFTIYFLVKFDQKHQKLIKFFLTGIEEKFTVGEIRLLWKVAKICHLEEALSLYWSIPSLSRCISEIKSTADRNNTGTSKETQSLLTKLYQYRTKIENEADKKKGLESTHYLDNKLRLRILLSGKGIFSSSIVNNARELTVSLPLQNGQEIIEPKDWVGKQVSVYVWRTGDARYVFDTTVLNDGIFLGRSVLYLRHTDKILRTQKRKSVRAKCSIYANLFIIKEQVIDYNAVETRQGYRCLIEDISESGAMVRIGGQGVQNIQLKLQFNINEKLIIMFGIVRQVEYNKVINQSRLHIEALHIEEHMKNEILSFVYNILPDNEKEKLDALSLLEEDIAEAIKDGDVEPPLDEDETKTVHEEDFPSFFGDTPTPIVVTDDIISATDKNTKSEESL